MVKKISFSVFSVTSCEKDRGFGFLISAIREIRGYNGSFCLRLLTRSV